jgi:hypothetical protein
MDMRRILNAAIAAACIAGAGLAATEASAQYYYDQYGRLVYRQPQVYNPYVYQQPQYVPPRVARKQAQLRERFVEKYGYPQYQQPYVYRQPRQYYQPQYGQPGYYYQRGPVPQYGTSSGSGER